MATLRARLKIDSRMKPLKKLLYAATFFIICSFAVGKAEHLVRNVNPFIGTGGHGHCYPGATVPFGMVQISPDNGTEGWDWCSGYNYGDSMIAGFSHMHLSGTGVGEWCDISVMPNPGLIPDTGKFFRVKFSHENEVAFPGYYSVIMNNGVQASFTATERCAFHKYFFPVASTPVIKFNLGFSINYDSTTETYFTKVDDSTFMGYRYSTGWAKAQRVYFAVKTSEPIVKAFIYDEGTPAINNSMRGHYVKSQLVFKDLQGKPLMMKVALSTVSPQRALVTLKEISDWGSFDEVRKTAENAWEKEMSKITVKGSDDRLKRIFYTALYHTCMAPVLYSDADGVYKNANDSTFKTASGQRYTVFSLWDTFRGLNPLFTLTQGRRNTDILNSMLAFCNENGELPVWDLSTWETGCMSGYHAVPVLADAVLKSTPGLDPEKAYAAMKISAFQKIRGTQDYIKYGYLPQDKGGYSVTITLEYAYDDWCIAQVAKKLGYRDDYEMFMKRSAAYRLLFDRKTGFIRAKNADGKFTEPFNPYFSSVDESKAMYEEGNAWQYTFFVPHDVQGLARMMGGKDKFIEKLDSLFTVPSQAEGEQSPPDISGLIGQYAHGNEPSHHIAYLYSFIGAPWKTQEKIRMIVDSMYHDNPQAGYAGNEDCGQMSAWAVWSMMGFYPANPASGEYVFGTPMFEEISINLGNGRTFKVTATNFGKNKPYIKSVKLNGMPYTKSYIRHADMVTGGKLEFEMSDKPNKAFGAKPEDWPYSASAL